MKYLRKFETEADVMMLVKPNVVLVGETGSVLYNVDAPMGVYIQHINGRLLTTDQWATGGFVNGDANGVAVITDVIKLVIAKDDLSATKKWSSNTSTLVEGIMSTSNAATAKTDLAGYDNTELMLLTDTSGAGYSCANYIFPNGARGYLPALGELCEAHKYKSEINAALAQIGGSEMLSNYYWSSTQTGGASYAWRISWSDGKPNNDHARSQNNPVRAFTTLAL